MAINTKTGADRGLKESIAADRFTTAIRRALAKDWLAHFFTFGAAASITSQIWDCRGNE